MRKLTKNEMAKVRRQVGRRFAVVNSKTLYAMVARNSRKEANQFVVAYTKGYGHADWLVVDTKEGK